MSLQLLIRIISIVLIVAWGPVIFRFFKQWRQRKNPISLALSLVISVVVYGDFLAFMVYSGFDSDYARALWQGTQTLACIFCYIAFWWSDHRFKDERNKTLVVRVPRILIVEDDQALNETLCEVLCGNEYAVTSSFTGEDGLTKLEQERIGLVILDLSLPGMSGWEFRRRQLSNPAIAAIPVVIISGHSPAGDVAPFMEAVDYLTKPFEPHALLAILDRFKVPKITGKS